MTKNTPAQWQTELGLDYLPSAHQCAIFEFVRDGRGHGVVEAVAGSGKTTTIVSAARIISEPGLFVAFNRPIALLLGEKLKGTTMASSTMHSHGFAAVRAGARGSVKLDGSKYNKALRIIEDGVLDGVLLGEALKPAENVAVADEGFPRSQILSLLEKARLGLVDARAKDFAAQLLALADHHRVDIEPGLTDIVVDIVRELMGWGASYTREIDFCDMVWLPVVNGYAPRKYSWVFVDECQDTTAAARELIRMSIKKGGRSLWVGDRRQAIYGFMGADAASFQRIVDTLDATILPLSVCYRCPTSVLALARELCPQIEARPGAPEGIVRDVDRDQLLDEAREGDMILCRLNAPLVSLCFALIGAGVAARVRGRSIGDGLKKVVTDACKRLPDFSMFGEALDAYEAREITRARKRSTDDDRLADALEAINDKIECVRVIWANSNATNPLGLKQAIDELFDDGKPSVILSSVHRAKGLEANRVFIAKPERLGVARKSAKAWMIEQELNLEYVAYTRALRELIFIGESATTPAPKPTKPAPKAIAAPEAPAALPPVDADAPDIYDASSKAARIALARRLDAGLRSWGFTPTRGLATEVVYELPMGAATCRVYSTIVGGEVRGLGKDAIRTSLVREGKGIGKTRRVNRVGKLEDIVARVKNRVGTWRGGAAEKSNPCGDPEPMTETARPDGSDEDDNGSALLPTRGSIRRAGNTVMSGRNHMNEVDVGDLDRADAYTDPRDD